MHYHFGQFKINAVTKSFQYSQLFDEHLSSGGTGSARSDVCERIHRLRRTDGCRALGLCVVWTVVWCVVLYSCVSVLRALPCRRACVRALWCGTVRCGAVRSGARVRRAVVPLVRRRRNVLQCRPSAAAASDLRFC